MSNTYKLVYTEQEIPTSLKIEDLSGFELLAVDEDLDNLVGYFHMFTGSPEHGIWKSWFVGIVDSENNYTHMFVKIPWNPTPEFFMMYPLYPALESLIKFGKDGPIKCGTDFTNRNVPERNVAATV